MARERISGGEVVVTMPTMAGMAYAGPDKQLYYPQGRAMPVIARWQLPQMEIGDEWNGRVSVGSAVNGYYHIAVNAATRGPNSSPYLHDDIYREAWMFVSERDGQLTLDFDPSVFPTGAAPVPGPLGGTRGSSAAAYGDMAADHDNAPVYAEVVYYHSASRGYQPAYGARIISGVFRLTGSRVRSDRVHTVPLNGIVALACPNSDQYLKGHADVPRTSRVESKTLTTYWDAHHQSCGDTITVCGMRAAYMPLASPERCISPREQSLWLLAQPVEVGSELHAIAIALRAQQ